MLKDAWGYRLIIAFFRAAMLLLSAVQVGLGLVVKFHNKHIFNNAIKTPHFLRNLNPSLIET
jgi:hypothetical protein